jgi:hypothetical protein
MTYATLSNSLMAYGELLFAQIVKI